MDAYVSKPFQADELMLKMDAVMGASQPYNKTERNETPKEKPLQPLPEKVTDREFLERFTAGKPDKMQKYINMFLENAPKLLESMENALIAKDYPAIKIAAHSLKPQLSYMGVKEEVSCIFMIEQSAGSSAHYDALPDRILHLRRVCLKAFEELKN
jgi:HPt (histidine-containing phosphotransfer) domain-containing protein